jgi:hypothetical protein
MSAFSAPGRATVIIKLGVAGLGDSNAHRSLLNLLFNDEYVKENAKVFLRRPDDQQSKPMGPSFEIIELTINSGFQIATLALAIAQWRQSSGSAAELVIEQGRMTTQLSTDELKDEKIVELALVGAPIPARSQCVLIGVSAYSVLEPLRAVGKNLDELSGALTDKAIWGVPEEQCVTIAEPGNADAVLTAVQRAADAAADTLLVYFAGHGLYNAGSGKGLHLGLPDATEDGLDKTVPWDDLRLIIDNSNAERRVVILDCCYSGRALDAGGDTPDLMDAATLTSTYIMAAASRDSRALAPVDEECTAFTGELVRVLREGIPGRSKDFLSLKDVYTSVLHELAAKQRPRPTQQDHRNISEHPFFHNLARHAPDAGPPRRSRPFRIPFPRLPRKRAHRLVAGGTTLVLIAALATLPVWWPGTSLASGPCASDARLAWVSDSLDQARFEGTTVGQLSALTMIDDDRALTVSDNTPPRLYELTIDDDRHEVKIDKVVTLLRRDGSVFPAGGFDGEGLVAQQSRVLVSSEAEPSIVQFNRTTGRETGRLTLPPEFKAASSGGQGQADREMSLEGLSVSPNEATLYAAMEAELTSDGSHQGQAQLRILRFEGTQGTDYQLKRQFAYRADNGLNLTEVLSYDTDRLLVLERAFIPDIGNTIRVYRVSLTGAPDVSRISLRNAPEEMFVGKELLFDLAKCPDSGAPELRQTQPNRLLDNVEGMALGTTQGDGWQRLYMVSDNNHQSIQRTLIYALDFRP